MRNPITIDPHDSEGIYVMLCDGPRQGPIVLETEGEDSSREKAEERAGKCSWVHRYTICRLVPVSGNSLLPLDMERMQRK
jgi:hypothetical protein